MMNDELRMMNRGFTLIELLVVLVITGIVASFIFANFVGVRQRGRDSQRKSDLKQIQTALELYRTDNKTYVAVLPGCREAFIGGGVTYMQKVPCDPVDGNLYFYNRGVSSAYTYTLYACLENTNDADRDGVNKCSIAGRVSYTVQNP